MKLSLVKFLLVLLPLTFVWVSCDDDDDDDDDAVTLYDRLGGDDMVDDPNNPGSQVEEGFLTIRTVVDSAAPILAADTVLADEFAVLLAEVQNGNTSGLVALKMELTNFIADAAGSENIEYTGLNMVDAHDPQVNPRMTGTSTDADFNAFLADVGMALEQNGVASGTELYDDLVALLESTRADVVQ